MVVNTVTFAKFRDYAVICSVSEILHEYLIFTEYKVQFIFAISAPKAFVTILLLHISRTLLLTYSAISMHAVP